ncbi:uncharacterized protein LOC116349701 [Contarinia nasturtii]|uniref:uncharacterized protein LOC116349701 n=1 Tax=Contarinia nasturtii TaxID=265458 RepID=UPI0012D3BB48|nr:uncharacterized protein LOC116349701 [Contarinia nasturtii]
MSKMDCQNPRDLKPHKLFSCIFCKKTKIHENKLREHHKNFHSDIPFGTDQYVFLKSVVAHEQCIVCEEVFPCSRKAQENHHKNHHSEFVSWKDIFEIIFLTTDKGGVQKRSRQCNKLLCHRCKKKIVRKDFLEHFERDHPKYYSRTGNHVATKKGKCHDARMDGADENDDEHLEQNGQHAVVNDIAENNAGKIDANGGYVVGNGDNEFTSNNKLLLSKGAIYYKCKLCQSEFRKKKRLKHYAKVHPNIQFELKNVTFAKTILTMFQCYLCQIILNKTEQQEHRQNCHPEFVNYSDLYVQVRHIDNISRGTKTWSVNKDAIIVRCNVCRKSIDRNNYAEHFQQEHPERLTSSEIHRKITKEISSERLHENDVEGNDGNNKNSPRNYAIIEKFYNCSVCNTIMKENNLRKHHNDFHSNVPYEAINFTLTKMSETMYQCSVCQKTLRRTDRQNHQQNYHPEFVFFLDTFNPIYHTHNVINHRKRWSQNKDAPMINCCISKCRMTLDRNDYVKHFQEKHPQRLISTEGDMKIKKEPGSKPVDVMEANELSDKNDPSFLEKDDYVTCNICYNEVVKCYQLDHHETVHSKIAYDVNNFTHTTSVVTMFQCFLCQVVLNRTEQQNHHENYHPEFEDFNDFFYEICFVHNITADTKKWTFNKDTNVFNCKLCCLSLNRNNFTEHFQKEHPERYNHPESSVNIEPPAKIKKEKVDGKPTDDSIGTKKRKGEPMPSVTIKKEKIDKESAKDVEMPCVKIKKEKIDAIDRELIKIGKNPATDTEIISYFKCTLCGKNKVKGKKLLKHHDKFHSGIPYQVNTYILNTKGRKTPEASDDDVAEPSEPREDEERTATKNGVQMNTSNTQNEDQSQSEAISMDAQSIDDQKEKDEMMTKITNGKINDAGRNSSSGTSELFTIAVSCAELQRLLQQNRIYSQNGQFILKDSE